MPHLMVLSSQKTCDNDQIADNMETGDTDTISQIEEKL